MGNAYITLAEIRARMAGDQPNLGPEFDATIVAKIAEISADLDRAVALERGIRTRWSFLADSANEVQVISIAGRPTGGHFTLAFGAYTTGSILFSASAATVQTALQGLTSIGAGNATVAGNPGGPWTVTFGGTLTGPQALITGLSVDLIPANVTVVSQELVAAQAASHSLRYFSGIRGGSPLLGIDDCVAITSVALYSPPGTLSRTLVLNVDYVAHPLQGTPIVALTSLAGAWPDNPGGIGVDATWGYATSTPYDVRETVAIETMRSRFGDQAGNSDVVGVTPFGTAQFTKAYSSKFSKLVADYRHGGAALRG